MVQRLTGRDENRCVHLFWQMYRQRHDIYVGRRRWSALTGYGGFERDRFDTPHATYLMALHQDRKVIGSLRLLPSNGPHLLADVFPHLIDNRRIPRSQNIYELTRFYVVRDLPPDQRRRTITHLSIALFEHCLDQRIAGLTSVVDTFLFPLLRNLGWRHTMLGQPCKYAEGLAAAVLIEIDEASLARMRASLTG